MASSLFTRSLLSRFLSNTTAVNSSSSAAAAASAAEEFSRLLLSIPSHACLETHLSHSKAPLTPSTVDSVLRCCSSSCHSSALRFFVWAGLQPGLRHSPAAYAAASSSLLLPSRPDSLLLLLDSYRRESSPVSSKTFKILLNLCRAADLPFYAATILKRMPEFGCRPDTPAYNAVFRILVAANGSSGSSSADTVVGLMEEMAANWVLPDMVTFVSAVRVLCGARRLTAARGLVARMRTHGCMNNVIVYSALLDGACACGELGTAMEILEEMERDERIECAPNVVTYTCLIKCLCERGRLDDALEVLDTMGRRRCLPNRVTIGTLVKGFCAEGHVDGAYELIEKMIGEGSASSEDCYSLLIVCLLRSGNREVAEGLVRRMLERGVVPDGLARNTFIRDLCLRRLFLDGYHWVGEFEEKGLVSFDSDVYSNLLAGLCEERHLVEALALGRKIIERGIKVEDDLVDGIVNMLNKIGEDDLASEVLRLKGIND